MEDGQSIWSDSATVGADCSGSDELLTRCLPLTRATCTSCDGPALWHQVITPNYEHISPISVQFVHSDSRAADWSPQNLIPLLCFLFSGKLLQTLRLAFTLLLSPPFCLFYLCLAYNYLLLSPHDSLLDLSSASLTLVMQGVVSAYNAWQFVGSWLYVVVCVLVWPMWLLPWTLSCQRVQPNPPHPHSE